MEKKLNSVLLIDDNPATNLIHKKVISKLDCANNIYVCTGGEQALDLLTEKENGLNDSYVQPQLVFLDINMPGMSGWDFIEEYEQLPEFQQGGIVIMMLTTSINPDDQAKAGDFKCISGFLNKPLSSDMLSNVLQEHFGHKVEQ